LVAYSSALSGGGFRLIFLSCPGALFCTPLKASVPPKTIPILNLILFLFQGDLSPPLVWSVLFLPR